MRKKIYRAKPVSNIKHSAYSVRGCVKRIKRESYPDNWSELSEQVKARDGYKCVCCPNTKNLQVHHIVSLSRGGTNKKTNLITLCKKCHEKRHKHL